MISDNFFSLNIYPPLEMSSPLPLREGEKREAATQQRSLLIIVTGTIFLSGIL